MKHILLSKEKIALVDDADYGALIKHTWHAKTSRRTWYAATFLPVNGGKRRIVTMHRFLLGDTETEIDHIDGNGLNNQRSNLRKATTRQNQWNAERQPKNPSGYKGVKSYCGKWQAKITHDYKEIYIGTFGTAEEAAHAFDAKAIELRGNFARLNFPEDHPAIKAREVCECCGSDLRANALAALPSLQSVPTGAALAALEQIAQCNCDGCDHAKKFARAALESLTPTAGESISETENLSETIAT